MADKGWRREGKEEVKEEGRGEEIKDWRRDE